MSETLNAKQRVAQRAVDLIEDGMTVGLGTGSTADYFIEALAERQRQGLDCVTVASSMVSEIKARSLGLKQCDISQIERLDVYVDGADEVTPETVILKGRGSDLVREKLLARASDVFYVLVDQTKLVDRLGQNFPIPIEVMPFAWRLVLQSLQRMGGQGELRPQASGAGLAMTSYGSLVLDMQFDDVNPADLDRLLNATPGVVEHGIFVNLPMQVFVPDDNVDVVEQRC